MSAEIEIHVGDIPPRTGVDFQLVVGYGGYQPSRLRYRCLDCSFGTDDVEEAFKHQREASWGHRAWSLLKRTFEPGSYFWSALGVALGIALVAEGLILEAETGMLLVGVGGLSIGIQLYYFQHMKKSRREWERMQREKAQQAQGVVKL